jgi:GH24 family phage-related lysozyme (muramidase)
MAAYGKGQMLGSGINPESFKQDYSGFANAAAIEAQGIANLGGKVGDYFKQQGEKKKTVKQASTQIDAAIKLFPDLAPMLSGVRDTLRDDDIPLSQRAADAETIAELINMGVTKLRGDATIDLERDKMGAEADYREAQLQAARDAAVKKSFVEIAMGSGRQQAMLDPTTGVASPIIVQGFNQPNQAASGGDVATSAAVGNDLMDFVKKFEGFKPKAYKDSEQISVGYGTRGVPGEVLTEPQAVERLQKELSGHARNIQNAANQMGIALNNNQFKALTSFDFNTGQGASLIKRFGRDPDALVSKMLEYEYDEGKKSSGLLNRRRIEAALFLTPEQEQAAPLQAPATEGRVGFIPNKPDDSEKTGKVVSLDELKKLKKELEDNGIKLEFVSNPNGTYTITGGSSVTVAKDSATKMLEGIQEARKVYREGNKTQARDILNSMRINGLLGGTVTNEDLEEILQSDEPVLPQPSKAPEQSPIATPETPVQGGTPQTIPLTRKPLGEILPK